MIIVNFLGLKGGANFYKANPLANNTYYPFIDPTKSALSKFNSNIGLGGFTYVHLIIGFLFHFLDYLIVKEIIII